MGKTLVLGASPKPHRFSYKAVAELSMNNYPVVAIGYGEGKILDIPIIKGKPNIDDVDTVALYLGRTRQLEYFDYIIQLNPNRIIFNPGTENPELKSLAQNAGIRVVESCMLIMLQTGNYENDYDDENYSF